MDNYYFYKKLEPIKSFFELSNPKEYAKVPDDWYLIASDVKNSTQNIEKGKYKEINMVGAMSIVSILNIDKTLELPYIFGGDGAFLLIPKKLLKNAKQALLAVKKLSKDAYKLDLRVGFISVKKLREFDKDIQLLKYELTENFYQALIRGIGLDYFETLLKANDKYHIKDSIDKNFVLDIEGLECRWKYVESSYDSTASLIFKCVDDKDYKIVLDSIERIIGSVEVRHPIDENKLHLSFTNKNLEIEVSLFSRDFIKKQLSLLKLKFINFLGLFLMKFKIGKWKNYKKRVVFTSDIQKFDNVVRMVFSSTHSKLNHLEEYLEDLYKKKKIIYGIKKSKYALMTCLIFERHGKHIHFVDTSDGGYALASKEFKQRAKFLGQDI